MVEVMHHMHASCRLAASRRPREPLHMRTCCSLGACKQNKSISLCTSSPTTSEDRYILMNPSNGQWTGETRTTWVQRELGRKYWKRRNVLLRTGQKKTTEIELHQTNDGRSDKASTLPITQGHEITSKVFNVLPIQFIGKQSDSLITQQVLDCNRKTSLRPALELYHNKVSRHIRYTADQPCLY